MSKLALNLLALLALVASPSAMAGSLTPGLVTSLRQGGYVLVMRHASSPQNPPAMSIADPENTGLERQLDAKGRAGAQAMGRAFRALHIPVGEVFSSPTYRAREMVRLAGLGTPRTAPELGDQGQSMARIAGAGPSIWLKERVSQKPARGRNTVIVTQLPNIAAAFPADAPGLEDGETLLFRPDGQGHADLIAKIPIADWPAANPP